MLRLVQMEAETMKTAKQVAADIAKQYGIETLEARNSDSLDFHDIAVWRLESMLEAAYRAGAATVHAKHASR